MERVEKALKLPEAPFKQVIEITISVFQKMISILHTAYDQLHESGGAESNLTVSDKLLITLQYYQEYRTMPDLPAIPADMRSKSVPLPQWDRGGVVLHKHGGLYFADRSCLGNKIKKVQEYYTKLAIPKMGSKNSFQLHAISVFEFSIFSTNHQLLTGHSYSADSPSCSACVDFDHRAPLTLISTA